MTPERWRRIDDLFDAALQLAPAEREPWLREACGGDEDLRAEVDRLLAGDERAAHDGFLTPPGEVVPPAAWDEELDTPYRSPLTAGDRDDHPRPGRIGGRPRRLHPAAGDRAAGGAEHGL